MIGALLGLSLAGAPAVTYFEPAGKQCAWVRQPLDGSAKVELARAEGDCAGASASWASGKALLRFDPERVRGTSWGGPGVPTARFPEPAPKAGAPVRLVLVDLASHAVTALPVPKGPGVLQEVALDKQGRPLALLLESKPPAQPSEVYEGTPATAHALRWSKEKGWEHVETAATAEGADYSPGVRALKVRDSLAPTTVEQLSPHPEDVELKDANLKKALAPLASKTAPDDPSDWVQLKGAPVVFWQTQAEFTYATGLVRALDGAKPVELPGLDFTAGDLVALQLREGYLLVASNTSGAHPRVYRLSDRKALLRSDTAVGATLDGP